MKAIPYTPMLLILLLLRATSWVRGQDQDSAFQDSTFHHISGTALPFVFPSFPTFSPAAPKASPNHGAPFTGSLQANGNPSRVSIGNPNEKPIVTDHFQGPATGIPLDIGLSALSQPSNLPAFPKSSSASPVGEDLQSAGDDIFNASEDLVNTNDDVKKDVLDPAAEFLQAASTTQATQSSLTTTPPPSTTTSPSTFSSTTEASTPPPPTTELSSTSTTEVSSAPPTTESSVTPPTSTTSTTVTIEVETTTTTTPEPSTTTKSPKIFPGTLRKNEDATAAGAGSSDELLGQAPPSGSRGSLASRLKMFATRRSSPGTRQEKRNPDIKDAPQGRQSLSLAEILEARKAAASRGSSLGSNLERQAVLPRPNLQKLKNSIRAGQQAEPKSDQENDYDQNIGQEDSDYSQGNFDQSNLRSSTATTSSTRAPPFSPSLSENRQRKRRPELHSTSQALMDRLRKLREMRLKSTPSPATSTIQPRRSSPEKSEKSLLQSGTEDSTNSRQELTTRNSNSRWRPSQRRTSDNFKQRLRNRVFTTPTPGDNTTDGTQENNGTAVLNSSVPFTTRKPFSLIQILTTTKPPTFRERFNEFRKSNRFIPKNRRRTASLVTSTTPLNTATTGDDHSTIQDPDYDDVTEQTPVFHEVTEATITPAPIKRTPITFAPIKRTPITFAPIKRTPITFAPIKQNPVTPAISWLTSTKRTPVRTAFTESTALSKVQQIRERIAAMLSSRGLSKITTTEEVISILEEVTERPLISETRDSSLQSPAHFGVTSNPVVSIRISDVDSTSRKIPLDHLLSSIIDAISTSELPATTQDYTSSDAPSSSTKADHDTVFFAPKESRTPSEPVSVVSLSMSTSNDSTSNPTPQKVFTDYEETSDFDIVTTIQRTTQEASTEAPVQEVNTDVNESGLGLGEDSVQPFIPLPDATTSSTTVPPRTAGFLMSTNGATTTTQAPSPTLTTTTQTLTSSTTTTTTEPPPPPTTEPTTTTVLTPSATTQSPDDVTSGDAHIQDLISTLISQRVITKIRETANQSKHNIPTDAQAVGTTPEEEEVVTTLGTSTEALTSNNNDGKTTIFLEFDTATSDTGSAIGFGKSDDASDAVRTLEESENLATSWIPATTTFTPPTQRSLTTSTLSSHFRIPLWPNRSPTNAPIQRSNKFPFSNNPLVSTVKMIDTTTRFNHRASEVVTDMPTTTPITQSQDDTLLDYDHFEISSAVRVTEPSPLPEITSGDENEVDIFHSMDNFQTLKRGFDRTSTRPELAALNHVLGITLTTTTEQADLSEINLEKPEVSHDYIYDDLEPAATEEVIYTTSQGMPSALGVHGQLGTETTTGVLGMVTTEEDVPTMLNMDVASLTVSEPSWKVLNVAEVTESSDMAKDPSSTKTENETIGDFPKTPGAQDVQFNSRFSDTTGSDVKLLWPSSSKDTRTAAASTGQTFVDTSAVQVSVSPTPRELSILHQTHPSRRRSSQEQTTHAGFSFPISRHKVSNENITSTSEGSSSPATGFLNSAEREKFHHQRLMRDRGRVREGPTFRPNLSQRRANFVPLEQLRSTSESPSTTTSNGKLSLSELISQRNSQEKITRTPTVRTTEAQTSFGSNFTWHNNTLQHPPVNTRLNHTTITATPATQTQTQATALPNADNPDAKDSNKALLRFLALNRQALKLLAAKKNASASVPQDTTETPTSDHFTTTSEIPLSHSFTTTSESSIRHSFTTTTESPIRHSFTTTTESPIRHSFTTTTERPISHSFTTTTETPISHSFTTTTETPISNSFTTARITSTTGSFTTDLPETTTESMPTTTTRFQSVTHRARPRHRVPPGVKSSTRISEVIPQGRVRNPVTSDSLNSQVISGGRPTSFLRPVPSPRPFSVMFNDPSAQSEDLTFTLPEDEAFSHASHSSIRLASLPPRFRVPQTNRSLVPPNFQTGHPIPPTRFSTSQPPQEIRPRIHVPLSPTPRPMRIKEVAAGRHHETRRPSLLIPLTTIESNSKESITLPQDTVEDKTRRTTKFFKTKQQELEAATTTSPGEDEVTTLASLLNTQRVQQERFNFQERITTFRPTTTQIPETTTPLDDVIFGPLITVGEVESTTFPQNFDDTSTFTDLDETTRSLIDKTLTFQSGRTTISTTEGMTSAHVPPPFNFLRKQGIKSPTITTLRSSQSFIPRETTQVFPHKEFGRSHHSTTFKPRSRPIFIDPETTIPPVTPLLELESLDPPRTFPTVEAGSFETSATTISPIFSPTTFFEPETETTTSPKSAFDFGSSRPPTFNFQPQKSLLESTSTQQSFLPTARPTGAIFRAHSSFSSRRPPVDNKQPQLTTTARPQQTTSIPDQNEAFFAEEDPPCHLCQGSEPKTTTLEPQVSENPINTTSVSAVTPRIILLLPLGNSTIFSGRALPFPNIPPESALPFPSTLSGSAVPFPRTLSESSPTHTSPLTNLPPADSSGDSGVTTLHHKKSTFSPDDGLTTATQQKELIQVNSTEGFLSRDSLVPPPPLRHMITKGVTITSEEGIISRNVLILPPTQEQQQEHQTSRQHRTLQHPQENLQVKHESFQTTQQNLKSTQHIFEGTHKNVDVEQSTTGKGSFQSGEQNLRGEQRGFQEEQQTFQKEQSPQGVPNKILNGDHQNIQQDLRNHQQVNQNFKHQNLQQGHQNIQQTTHQSLDQNLQQGHLNLNQGVHQNIQQQDHQNTQQRGHQNIHQGGNQNFQQEPHRNLHRPKIFEVQQQQQQQQQQQEQQNSQGGQKIIHGQQSLHNKQNFQGTDQILEDHQNINGKQHIVQDEDQRLQVVQKSLSNRPHTFQQIQETNIGGQQTFQEGKKTFQDSQQVFQNSQSHGRQRLQPKLKNLQDEHNIQESQQTIRHRLQNPQDEQSNFQKGQGEINQRDQNTHELQQKNHNFQQTFQNGQQRFQGQDNHRGETIQNGKQVNLRGQQITQGGQQNSRMGQQSSHRGEHSSRGRHNSNRGEHINSNGEQRNSRGGDNSNSRGGDNNNRSEQNNSNDEQSNSRRKQNNGRGEQINRNGNQSNLRGQQRTSGGQTHQPGSQQHLPRTQQNLSSSQQNLPRTQQHFPGRRPSAHHSGSRGRMGHFVNKAAGFIAGPADAIITGFGSSNGESFPTGVASSQPSSSSFSSAQGALGKAGDRGGAEPMENDPDGDKIPGRGGVDYPGLERIPETGFLCTPSLFKSTKMFADPETSCQVYHVCSGHQKFSFLCPKGTIFHQNTQVCQWWFTVDCEQQAQKLAEVRASDG
nr:mucin-5AC-like [Procambarus clarkii]